MNKAKPTLDRKTGRQYPSRNQTGTALAQEFGEPIDSWVWYRVLKRPNRTGLWTNEPEGLSSRTAN